MFVLHWHKSCCQLCCQLCCADYIFIIQLMPLLLTVSCFSKIQIGFTFLVPAYLGSPGQGPLNGCVCVYVCISFMCLHVHVDLIQPLSARNNKYCCCYQVLWRWLRPVTCHSRGSSPWSRWIGRAAGSTHVSSSTGSVGWTHRCRRCQNRRTDFATAHRCSRHARPAPLCTLHWPSSSPSTCSSTSSSAPAATLDSWETVIWHRSSFLTTWQRPSRITLVARNAWPEINQLGHVLCL